MTYSLITSLFKIVYCIALLISKYILKKANGRERNRINGMWKTVYLFKYTYFHIENILNIYIFVSKVLNFSKFQDFSS